MLTPAQSESLTRAMIDVVNAESQSDKRRAANNFRDVVATVAAEIDCPDCLIALADPKPELDEVDCKALINQLEANSPT